MVNISCIYSRVVVFPCERGRRHEICKWVLREKRKYLVQAVVPSESVLDQVREQRDGSASASKQFNREGQSFWRFWGGSDLGSANVLRENNISQNKLRTGTLL